MTVTHPPHSTATHAPYHNSTHPSHPTPPGHSPPHPAAPHSPHSTTAYPWLLATCFDYLSTIKVRELEAALAQATARATLAKQAQAAIRAKLAVLRGSHPLLSCECPRCGGKCFGKVTRYRKCSRCENNRRLKPGPVETPNTLTNVLVLE